MTNAAIHANRSSRKLLRTAKKIAIRLCIVLGVLSVLILIGAFITWSVASHTANKDLAVQVAKVRSRGEPLTLTELNEFYKPAPNRPDMTEEIVAALDLCSAVELNALASTLPLVGGGPQPPPISQEWPQIVDVEAYLKRFNDAIATFHEIARRDATARFPVDLRVVGLSIVPEQHWIRQGGRILALQFYVDLHRGRTTNAVDCVLAEIALGRILDSAPLLLSQFLRLSFLASAMSHLQELAKQAETADGDLERLRQGVRGIEFQPIFKRMVAGERAFGYTACIDPVRFSDDPNVASAPEVRDFGRRLPWCVSNAARLLEISMRVSEAADESLLAGWRTSEAIITELTALRTSMFGIYHYQTTLLVPVYSSALSGFMRNCARRDCADVLLSAELYRRRNGQWPESIEQLVPEHLDRVPIDPFTNTPLKIFVTREEFKVYSVGEDGNDDRGKFSAKLEPGTDIGFVYPLRQAGSR